MNPSRSSSWFLTLAAAALAASTTCSRRPDVGPVIIYLVDSLRPDRTTVYGAERPTTPAAEALAKEGVTYTNAFALSTWTRPSVATLLTSLLPAKAGALNRWGRLDESVWYLPQAIRKEGWATAAFVANGNIFDERLGFQRGMDVFRTIIHAPTGEWHATAREVVEPALKFVQAQRSPRFFLFVHVVDPHAPYVLEPEYQGLFAAGTPLSTIPIDYDRSVRQADDQLARLADALRRKGFWETATIILTADHGEEFGEHGATSHGHSVHEEQLRVPLVIKYPNGEGRGLRLPDPVTLADLTPTIAELYRLAPSPEWTGRSLWRRRMPADRDIYFTEDLDGNRLYGLRRGTQKLVVQLYPRFARTLYSLDRDPLEKAGVELSCGSAAAVDPALQKALDAWRARDLAAVPSLRFADAATQPACRATIDLTTIRKPFLTAEDFCRWSRLVDGGRLTFRRDAAPAGPLYLSADDHGRPPRVAFAPGGPPCSVLQIKSNFLAGPTSEEYLKRLRSLGYLQGS